MHKTHTRIRTHTHTITPSHAHVHTHTHTHLHTHTHTHNHTITQSHTYAPHLSCLFMYYTRHLLTTHHISSRHLISSPFFLEIHTGKIHMYFVTSVLYEITCITSNTDKPDTDSNPGLWLLIYMTNTVSTNISRQKKIHRPTKFPWRSSGAGFLLYNRGYLSTAGSATRCTYQRVTVAHKRVPLVPAALSPLLVVTGHRLGKVINYKGSPSVCVI